MADGRKQRADGRRRGLNAEGQYAYIFHLTPHFLLPTPYFLPLTFYPPIPKSPTPVRGHLVSGFTH